MFAKYAHMLHNRTHWIVNMLFPMESFLIFFCNLISPEKLDTERGRNRLHKRRVELEMRGRGRTWTVRLAFEDEK